MHLSPLEDVFDHHYASFDFGENKFVCCGTHHMIQQLKKDDEDLYDAFCGEIPSVRDNGVCRGGTHCRNLSSFQEHAAAIGGTQSTDIMDSDDECEDHRNAPTMIFHNHLYRYLIRRTKNGTPL